MSRSVRSRAGSAPLLRRPRGRVFLRRVVLAGAVAVISLSSLPTLHDVPAALVAGPPTTVGPTPGALLAALLDPAPSLGSEALRFQAGGGSGTASRSAFAAPETRSETPATLETAPEPAPGPIVRAMPLPVPRPSEIQPGRVPPSARLAERPVPRRARAAALPEPTSTLSFFERLFGRREAADPALAYAAPESPRDAIALSGRSPARPDAAAGSGIAVYDISARVVHLPNGERLEAHSGLRDKLDDPRYVHVRMRGATPPGTYDLTERERLFHGVRAIRLNPVGGSAGIFGRDGLLAHTYMLGPNGDSNGCVSLKDYDRFLQAFLRGEIRRLVVVAGRIGDRSPSLAGDGGVSIPGSRPRDT